MSSFEDRVLGVVAGIPRGETYSYGEVADAAGFPGAARAVGNLLRVTAVEVPWWRVIGADGQLRAPDPDRQASMLRDEGVEIVDRRVTRFASR